MVGIFPIACNQTNITQQHQKINHFILRIVPGKEHLRMPEKVWDRRLKELTKLKE
jgi:hypothetical protein